MASRAVASVAGIIDRLEDRPCRPGRPPLPTIEVVETLHSFVREGVQWRQPRAAAGRASGSTLRRRPDGRGATALLRQVHVALIRPVRAGPEVAAWDVVVDSCPVRAERGGEPTGPDPTDRGKRGTKYHVVASTDGLPLGLVPSAADVHGTRLFPRLPRPAQVARAAIGRLCADAAGACPPAGGAGRGAARRAAGCASGTASSPASGWSARRTAPGSARCGALRGRARLRVVARQQAAGPAPGPARPGDPGPADGRPHLRRRGPPRPVLKTVPYTNGLGL